MSRQLRAWKTVEVARLLALYRNGATLDAIARELGRTPGSVRCQLYPALGGQVDRARPWRPAEDAALREHLRLGSPRAAIARALHRSVASVNNRAKLVQEAAGRSTVVVERQALPLPPSAELVGVRLLEGQAVAFDLLSA